MSSANYLSLLSVVFHTQMMTISSYFLSTNPVSWWNASNFCQYHCNSDLISIHSNEEYLRILRIIENSLDITNAFNYTNLPVQMALNNVWTGLNNLTGEFTWTDGSPFDFASDISGGVYPWNSAPNKGDYEPNNFLGEEKCTHIWTQWGTMNDDHCYSKFMFMCNDCDGKINKYVSFNDEKLNYANSDAFCKDKFGTSLASVHDRDDQELAADLCKLVDITGGMYGTACWIGGNDKEVEAEWIWTDGTYFDFGTDLSGSVWPWADNSAQNEPNNNNGNEDCVELTPRYNYDWNDQVCGVGKTNNFICYLPSEICQRFIGNWNILSGDVYWDSNDDCILHSNLHSLSMIENKIWTMSNQTWIVIDYMFTAHNVVTDIGKVGVVLYLNDQDCVDNYYFVGVSVNDIDGETKIFMDRHFNDTIESIFESSTNMYIYDRFYKFRVELRYNTTLNLYLWSIKFIEFEITFQADSSLLDYMGFQNVHIGMRNDAINMTAKSLFISAPDDFITTGTVWNLCTSSPTIHPTANPTIDPTIDPSTYPTSDPTNNPTFDPTKDPTFHPTINPTKVPTTNPIVTNDPTGDPTLQPTFQPTMNPLKDGEMIENTPSPTQVGTGAVIVDSPATAHNLELYFYFGIGIVVLLICIIVLLILIYRRYYMQDAEKELIKNTSVGQTDITITHETHVASNKKVNPSKVQDGKLKENMDNNNIGMTEIITVAGMDINTVITPMDDADIITTSGDLEDGNTVRDEHNHEHNHRQFKSEDLYSHEDEDQDEDEDQGSNEDNNDKDMEDMYSTNNSPLTPEFPRVATDPGLNQQLFKL